MGLKDRAYKAYALCPYLEYDEFIKKTFSLRTKSHEELKDLYKEKFQEKGYICVEEFPLSFQDEDYGRVDLLCYNESEARLIEIKSYSEHFAKLEDVYQLLLYLRSFHEMLNKLKGSESYEETVREIAKKSKVPEERLDEILKAVKELLSNGRKTFGELVVRGKEGPKALVVVSGDLAPRFDEDSKALQPGYYCRFCKHYDHEEGICTKVLRTQKT